MQSFMLLGAPHIPRTCSVGSSFFYFCFQCIALMSTNKKWHSLFKTHIDLYGEHSFLKPNVLLILLKHIYIFCNLFSQAGTVGRYLFPWGGGLLPWGGTMRLIFWNTSAPVSLWRLSRCILIPAPFEAVYSIAVS